MDTLQKKLSYINESQESAGESEKSVSSFFVNISQAVTEYRRYEPINFLC